LSASGSFERHDGQLCPHGLNLLPCADSSQPEADATAPIIDLARIAIKVDG